MGDNTEIIATLPPLHPGEVLREEFLVPLGLSAGKVAKACGIPRTRIERITTEKLGITGDTAVRLGRVLGTGPELWMNLQARFATESARAALAKSCTACRRCIEQPDFLLQAPGIACPQKAGASLLCSERRYEFRK